MVSTSRIAAALLLLIAYQPGDPLRGWISVGLVLFIILSDLLDGRLARYLGVASTFGYVLDGLCDRAVHIAAYLLLLKAQLVPEYLVWAMMFRELCQYCVRLVEPGGQALQASLDRHVTRLYSGAVHAVLLVEVVRAAVAPDVTSPTYALAITAILGTFAAVSYARILPQLYRAGQSSRR